MRLADTAAVACAAAAAAIGLFILVGWIMQSTAMVTFGLSSSTKPNVALAIAFGAVATIALVKQRMMLSRVLSAIVLTYGAAGIFQRVAGVDLNIDDLLIHDFLAAAKGRLPGRPALETTLGVCLMAATIFAATFPNGHRTAARIGYALKVLVLLAFTQQLTGADSLFPTRFAGHIAFPSVVSLGLLAIAAQCALGRRAGHIYEIFATDAITAQLRRIITVPVVLVAGTATLCMVLFVQLVESESALAVARSSAVTFVLVLATVWFVVEGFGETLRKRLEQLTSAAAQVGTGQFDVEVPAGRHDEVGRLADAVDDMAIALKQQKELVDLTIQAQWLTGAATTLPDAFAAFSDLVQSPIPHRRAALFEVEDEGIRVVASHGPLAAAAPPGTFMRFGAERVRQFKAMTEPESVPFVEPGTPGHLPDVRSYIAVPVVVAGEVQMAITFMSDETNAFGEEHRALAAHLVNDVSGTFQHLLLLALETDARRRLAQVNRMRAEFVAVVAHDLRSPMSVIANMADMLEREWTSLTDTERADYLQRLSRRSRTLSRFVEDALNVAKIDSGELVVDAKPVDIAKLAQRVTDDFRFLWPQREFNLHVDNGSVVAVADEERQWRILTNLLVNACTYSPPEGAIDVRVSNGGETVKVSVSDQGSGIDPSEHHAIFDKFVRVPSERNGEDNPSGSGLGLYICRRLVEVQGGAISVESTVDGGSTFTYTVPAMTGSEAQ